MKHGVIEVFAYQETLLVMAVFGIAILAMIWVGFRRWLQYKEKTAHLIAEQTAELAAQYGAHMERVEARLKMLERNTIDGGDEAAPQIDAPDPNPPARAKRDDLAKS